AARGTDGRGYPYGNEYDPMKANTDDTGLQQTSAVGMFPDGASPYGVLDMSGNVWEWCLTDYEKPASDAASENLRSDARRVLRGGSWSNSQGGARAADRFVSGPFSRNLSDGFRVLRPPSR
ncbi:MAG: SUMF1/EgtB/PvdO family nonheme iron enzyme, partial [Anaerolineae bacterium]|nr:SUMF1/EgtB/PvdO family nonheme iron enzyme [Anaerolineae bacterium]